MKGIWQFLAFGCLVMTVLAGLVSFHLFFWPGSGGAKAFIYGRALHETCFLGFIFASIIGLISPLQKKDRKGDFLAWCFFAMGLSFIVAIVSGHLGGKEYWRIPTGLDLFVLPIWLVFGNRLRRITIQYQGPKPVYFWMWWAGWIGFLFTYLEAHLYLLPWFSQYYSRELTLQWKSMGTMVGSWNMFIYGLNFRMMRNLLGEANKSLEGKSFFFFFVSLTNMLFNWGHHLYPVPNHAFLQWIAYAVSMTEWVFFLKLIRDWREILKRSHQYRQNWAFRFLEAAEFWAYFQLLFALLLSIPAVNRYTHGSHFTVMHAMGSAIGINVMILLGVCLEKYPTGPNKFLAACFWFLQIGLSGLCICLFVLGLTKLTTQESFPLAAFKSIPGIWAFGMGSGLVLLLGYILYMMAIFGWPSSSRMGKIHFPHWPTRHHPKNQLKTAEPRPYL